MLALVGYLDWARRPLSLIAFKKVLRDVVKNWQLDDRSRSRRSGDGTYRATRGSGRTRRHQPAHFGRMWHFRRLHDRGCGNLLESPCERVASWRGSVIGRIRTIGT